MPTEEDDPTSPVETPPTPVLGAADAPPAETVRVEVHRADGAERTLLAPRGATLRDALLAGDCSPYARLAERANCGGRGLCATCGVRFADAPAPEHWHDRLAARFGYPRLSCQITVEGDCTVEIPDKRYWGGRE